MGAQFVSRALASETVATLQNWCQIYCARVKLDVLRSWRYSPLDLADYEFHGAGSLAQNEKCDPWADKETPTPRREKRACDPLASVVPG